jgi:uncharacterized membrane protein
MSWIPFGCLPLLLFVVLAFLFPLFLADAMMTALAKLGLSAETSVLAVMMIFIGSMVNIPVRRIPRDVVFENNPFAMFGFNRMFPSYVRQRRYTVIAVNLGGCVVPGMMAVYQLFRLAASGAAPLLMGLLGVLACTVVCYALARPVPNVGIAMPPLAPALVAAVSGLIAGHELAPAIAFASGVLGALIGADLLHLREIGKLSTGVASIGGAGTFDGIVIAGLVATLLA